MEITTVWWLLAGAAVAVELVTGTFYLLMLAIGLAAAALSGHLGAGLNLQLLVAALVSAATLGGWHYWRGTLPQDAAAGANRDVNLDVGETIRVDAWNADGTASVKYRGANWTVVCASDDRTAGMHKVREVVGNRLVVEKI